MILLKPGGNFVSLAFRLGLMVSFVVSSSVSAFVSLPSVLNVCLSEANLAKTSVTCVKAVNRGSFLVAESSSRD